MKYYPKENFVNKKIKDGAIKLNGRIRERNGIYHAVMYWYIGDKQQTRSFSTKIRVKGKAEEKEAKRMLAVAMDKFIPTEVDRTMTKVDLYIEDYLEIMIEKYIIFREIAITTQNTVRKYVRIISSFFRGKKIVTKELSKTNVDNFLLFLLDEKKLSSYYAKQIFTTLKALVEMAVEENLLSYEMFYRTFSKKTRLKMKKKEYKILYSQDLKRFYKAIETSPFKLELTLLLSYGLRKGELLGLTFSRISDKLDIVESLAFDSDSNTYYINKYLKTEQSRRTLPLFESIETLVEERKERIKKDKAFFKKNYNMQWSDYICIDKKGDILKYSRLNNYLISFCKKNNFVALTPHSLRHSFATIMHREGMDIRDLQLWLGHADVKMTANTYVHFDSTKNKLLGIQVSKIMKTS